MASPRTIKAKLEAENRSQVAQQEAVERYAKTHPSLPRTSRRWVGRSKGIPFSKTLLIDTVAAQPGKPATLVLKHPTRGRVHRKHATAALLSVFFPSLPENLAAAMLGH